MPVEPQAQQINVDDIPENLEETEELEEEVDPDETNDEESETEDSEESDEPEELPFNLDSLESSLGEPVSDGSPLVKPLDFVSTLTPEQQTAIHKQLSDLSKPIEQLRELRGIIAPDDPSAVKPDDIKTFIKAGVDWTEFSRDFRDPATQSHSIALMLDQLEYMAGKTIEELLPDRFGYEVDPTQMELTRLQKQLKDKESQEVKDRKLSQWVTSEAPKVVSTFKERAGFEPDPSRIAPFILQGKTALESVRLAHGKEWDNHLFELGKKEGLRLSKVKSVPDIPSNKKVGESVEYFTKGPFKGQPKPK